MRVAWLLLAVLVAGAFATETTKKLVRKKIRKITSPVSSTYIPKNTLKNLNTQIIHNRNSDKTISSTMNKLKRRLGNAKLKKMAPVNSILKKNDSDMLLIPVPESQQKAYQPVILQVAKNNQSNSDTKVVSYKLNKLFVPLGIYGKVMENGTEREGKRDDVSLTTDKVDISKISFTTERVDAEKVQLDNGWTSVTKGMQVPVPLNNEKTSLFEGIVERASGLSGYLHKGLVELGRWRGGNKNNSPNNKDSAVSASNYAPKKSETFVPNGKVSYKDYLFPPQKYPINLKEYFGQNYAQNYDLAGGRSLQKKFTQIAQKYSRTDLDLARDKIYDLFQGKSTRRDGNPAYEDLLDLFRAVFTLGNGVANNVVRDFTALGKNGGRGIDSNWKPVDRSDSNSRGDILTFSAGVSYPRKSLGGHYGNYEKFTEKEDNGHYEKPEVKSEESHYTKPIQTKTKPSEFQHFQPESMESWSESKQINVMTPPKETPSYHQTSDFSETQDDSEYELIPHSQYIQNQGSYELAAVIKPKAVSDEIVRETLGEFDSPMIEYESPQGLHNIQKYLTAKTNENRVSAEAYKDKERDYVYNYGTDPEIAQLVNQIQNRRHDYSDAMEKQTFQKPVPVAVKPQKPVTIQNFKKPAASQKPSVKFFAPIPISKTTISSTLRGRYKSSVPRYVVELAKKLQKDKDVQGIVRVSQRGKNGQPVEFLYPVRG